MTRWAGTAAVAIAAAAGMIAAGTIAVAQSSSPFSGLFGDRDPSEGSPVKLDFDIAGDNASLDKSLKNASLLTAALTDRRFTGQDILAAARGDYARLLGNLYDEGYYDAIISIRLDGKEAAEIAPLDAPASVSRVVVDIQPGSQLHFSRAAIAPLAPDTRLPPDYRVGGLAGTGVIKSAATEGVRHWRQVGRAKADVSNTEIIADHPRQTVDSQIALAPGPVVTFGEMHVTGLERLREKRLREIAGFPTGKRFDPDSLDAVRARLRRSGVFSAITLSEADRLGPGDTLDVDLALVEAKPRRIGGGIEFSTDDGAAISGYWMHRNLWGGGERLRIDARLGNLGAKDTGRDDMLSFRLGRPATFSRDLTAYFSGGIARTREDDYDSDTAFLSLGLDYYRSDTLSGGIALKYEFERVTDANGTTDFSTLSLPANGIYDKRDSDTDPKRGYWLQAEITPFAGLNKTTGSGVRAVGEARVYYTPGEAERLTFALRGRGATVLGPSIEETPRSYLFYSGGGGTVRGQPYQSLGVEVISGPDGPIKTGGMSLAVLNAEARFRVTEKIGVVGFADYGRVWDEGGFKGENGWQAGAGIGLRYFTPIGPIRLDVAAPVGSEPDTDKGLQLYLGIGQAF